MAKDYGNEKQQALDLLERLWQSYGDVRLVRLCTSVVLASFDFQIFGIAPSWDIY